ncbi:MAG TPA: VOC family protein, partial [Polyangia bacterium]
MRFDALTLSSRDLARSRAFYTGKLGFRVLAEDGRSYFMVDAGGIKLHVDAESARSPLASAEPRLVFRTEAVAERCTTLRDLGVSVDGPRATD